MRRGETGQPMHQPFRGEILRGADREYAGTLPLYQPLRGGADVIKRLADLDEIVAAGGRDLEALALAVDSLTPSCASSAFTCWLTALWVT